MGVVHLKDPAEAGGPNPTGWVIRSALSLPPASGRLGHWVIRLGFRSIGFSALGRLVRSFHPLSANRLTEGLCMLKNKTTYTSLDLKKFKFDEGSLVNKIVLEIVLFLLVIEKYT